MFITAMILSRLQTCKLKTIFDVRMQFGTKQRNKSWMFPFFSLDEWVCHSYILSFLHPAILQRVTNFMTVYFFGECDLSKMGADAKGKNLLLE